MSGLGILGSFPDDEDLPNNVSVQTDTFTYIIKIVLKLFTPLAALCVWQGTRSVARDHSAVQAFGYLATAAACTCLIVLWIQAFVHDQTGHIIVSSSPHKKEFAHRASTFGPPLPALGIRGRLILAKPDIYACSLDNITRASGESNDPVSEVNFSEDAVRFEWPPWELPILLVSRGGTFQVGPGKEERTCTFVDKVRIAQAAGYGAVVVYNNRHNTLGPARRQRWMYRMTTEEGEDVSDIIIPSVFTSALDGQIMVKLLNRPPAVQTLSEGAYAAEADSSAIDSHEQPPNLRSTAFASANQADSPQGPQPPGGYPTVSLYATVHPANFNDPGVAALVSSSMNFCFRVASTDIHTCP
jgi:hypothetical protein